MEYRVFKESVGWSEGLFIIDSNLSFKEIKTNPSTSFLSKKNYLGLFKFDENFLNLLQSKKVGDYYIYYEYLWERDRLIT